MTGGGAGTRVAVGGAPEATGTESGSAEAGKRGAGAAGKATYQGGFGNTFSSEALPGALPKHSNNPRVCPHGLYAEQLSGSAFTVPRRGPNLRTWLYRIRPSVTHEPFTPLYPSAPHLAGADFTNATATPNQLRWLPCHVPGTDEAPIDFVRGLFTMCGAGSPGTKSGYAVHTYAANASMADTCLANADGDFLIVPQLGALSITTEIGKLDVEPGWICVMPRGLRFSVDLPEGRARGYVLEVFEGHFQLPDLGPIGANGLADARHFETPCAWYEEREVPSGFTVLHKFEGCLFKATQDFSPFNVVAWHGNYVPYRYDLAKFCPVNTVAFDHADPSIFTVLTCPSTTPGVAVADFVIFPPRWLVAEGTFRPPYYHRNCMNEFMGLIKGIYEAKQDGGFQPGGASLHSCMTPHGPDTVSFEHAVREDADVNPVRIPRETLAFMFETNMTPRVTAHALSLPTLDTGYYKCWVGLKSHFSRSEKRSREEDERLPYA